MKMHDIKVAILAAGLLGSLSLSPANAIPLDGSLSISGQVTYDTTADTVQFGLASQVSGSGSFAAAVFGTAVTMRNVGVPVSYAAGALAAGSNLACGAGCVFTTVIGGLTATFNLTSYVFSEVPTLSIIGSGFASLTGFDLTPGIFEFTTQGPGQQVVSFSSTVTVPGPIVGAGLPGLILACAGLVALARRRRTAIA